MEDQLIRQEPAVAAQALLELAEANVSPVAHEQAWETEIGFLKAVEEDEDRDLTALVSAVLDDETMLA
jgi:hypothetical protein